MLQWIFILPISFLLFFFWFGASWSAKQALAFHFLANSGTAIKSVLAILAHLVIRIIAFAIFAKIGSGNFSIQSIHWSSSHLGMLHSGAQSWQIACFSAQVRVQAKYPSLQ